MRDMEYCNQPHVRAVEGKDDGLAVARCRFEADGFLLRWRDGRPADISQDDWCKLARRCRAMEERSVSVVTYASLCTREHICLLVLIAYGCTLRVYTTGKEGHKKHTHIYAPLVPFACHLLYCFACTLHQVLSEIDLCLCTHVCLCGGCVAWWGWHTSTYSYAMAVRKVTAASEGAQDGMSRPTHVTKYPLAQASTPKGLTFEAGRPVVVLRQEPTGWWWVSIDGAEGEAPANYLEEGGENGSPVEHSPTVAELRALRDAGIFTDVQLASLSVMHADLEAYTNGWISATLRLLESLRLVPGAELVMVTNSELAPALVKTLLFRLGRSVPKFSLISAIASGCVLWNATRLDRSDG